MKFKAGTRRKAIEYENDLVKYWKENKTFEKSVDMRPKSNPFVFYDGPPFLTGTPHHGHLLISSVKDTVARFQTMQGKRVERRWGWDCHGLPAELFVEKKLGITSKKEIGIKISIADYVRECRAAMVKTGTEWEDTIERIGRWVEFNDAYKTMDPEFMESVWWAFKTLYEKGKVYEGEKILIYCTKDATPISKSEVAMENSYQLDTDPSVYVYFKLEDSDEYVMAWTTTPWTLPANVAVAINPSVDYVLVEYEGKKVYVAKKAAEKVFTDVKHQPLPYIVLKTVKGSELVGRKYHPLFENHGPDAHRILAADFVTAEDGTGIAHEAPAYGEEDYELCKAEGVPLISLVDENGLYTEGHWQGQNIWEVNKEIAKTMVADGRAFKVEYITHEYPHCHRCNGKLMYRAHPSWFLDIQAQKSEMVKANDATSWTPKYLKEGRFKNIIESAPDWNLSRDRYWATPIPVWRGYKNDGTEVIKVIGSYDEFETLTGKRLYDYHLPNVMDVTFEYEGVTLHHIAKVLDCWFESGSMPFAQFPADFIVEAIDQTRGWFYALTAVNVALFGVSPFKNLICTGFINAPDGKKLSKKLKNYTDPLELMDSYSVDAFRMLLMGSNVMNGEDFALKDREVSDINRKLAMVWNMYDFFTLYASVDGWEFDGKLADPLRDCQNPLDIWVISRVHQLILEVKKQVNAYNLPEAIKPILEFIEDASNWYVRRSRKRFWKSEDDNDKNNAYRTLHYVLTQLSKVMAPFTPFLAEELYRSLTVGESVHLLDWPVAGDIQEELLSQMEEIRGIITRALGLRAEAGIKVRQPLQKLMITSTSKTYPDDLIEIIKEEVNVKEVIVEDMIAGGSVEVTVTEKLDLHLTSALKREGLMREVIRLVQSARKQADLQVDDRIDLSLVTESKELQEAIDEHKQTIMAETLALGLSHAPKDYKHTQEGKVEGRLLQIHLQKA
jgi:isoleucyl-tRNA synthetase